MDFTISCPAGDLIRVVMLKTTFKITIVSVDCYNHFFLQFHKA